MSDKFGAKETAGLLKTATKEHEQHMKKKIAKLDKEIARLQVIRSGCVKLLGETATECKRCFGTGIVAAVVDPFHSKSKWVCKKCNGTGYTS